MNLNQTHIWLVKLRDELGSNKNENKLHSNIIPQLDLNLIPNSGQIGAELGSSWGMS
jgi:hypothetical protein